MPALFTHRLAPFLAHARSRLRPAPSLSVSLLAVAFSVPSYAEAPADGAKQSQQGLPPKEVPATQQESAGAVQASEEDYEVDANAGSAAPGSAAQGPTVPAPAAPPPNGQAAPATVQEPTQPAAQQPVSPTEGAAHRAPPADSEAGAPPARERRAAPKTEPPAPTGGRAELEREGSNYRRSLRPGFAVQGFAQVQYQSSQLSQDQLDADGAPLNQDQFGVRRARVRLDHGWDFAFATLELDAGTLGGASLRLRRAEASLFFRGGAPVEQTPWAVLTAGVTDLPFGGELAESQRDRLFMEQSIASRALFPTPADLGAKLWGAYEALEYGIALVNGEPTDGSGIPSDRNAHKDAVGRVGFQSELGVGSLLGAGLSFYAGQGFSPGTPATKDSLVWVDTNNNGAVEDGEVQGVTGSSAVPSKNFDRWATALDAHARIETTLGITKLGGEAYFASNLDRGVLPSDPVTVGGDALALGGSVYVVQQIAEHFLIGVRGAYYDPNVNLTEERAGAYHLNDQSYVELSPTIGVSFQQARLSFEYDFLFDHLGRDQLGVPTDVRNDHFTLRLQVGL